jgi:predicted signal transduction protein with EAL and GGDEF domain
MTSTRNSCCGALMALDLDNFQPLNDTHGHQLGDLLLLETATPCPESHLGNWSNLYGQY